jgi:hypothetical protein
MLFNCNEMITKSLIRARVEIVAGRAIIFTPVKE